MNALDKTASYVRNIAPMDANDVEEKIKAEVDTECTQERSRFYLEKIYFLYKLFAFQ